MLTVDLLNYRAPGNRGLRFSVANSVPYSGRSDFRLRPNAFRQLYNDGSQRPGMDIRLVKTPIPFSEVAQFAKSQFGEMIKATVDVQRAVLALGGELHSDEEALLIEDGSRQEDLWGINIYPEQSGEDRVEFDSMINVRPSQNNRSRGVENAETRARILEIVGRLLLS